MNAGSTVVGEEDSDHRRPDDGHAVVCTSSKTQIRTACYPGEFLEKVDWHEWLFQGCKGFVSTEGDEADDTNDECTDCCSRLPGIDLFMLDLQSLPGGELSYLQTHPTRDPSKKAEDLR